MKSRPKEKSPDWHAFDNEKAAHLLDVNIGTGLTSAQVRERLRQFGPNTIKPRPAKSNLSRFFGQFNQPLAYVLLAAVAVTALVREWIDSSAIFLALLINGIVGFIQEAKAEKAIEALLHMLAARSTVLRDGAKQLIDSHGLVPGDVVFLAPGDRVPADLRLMHVHNLQIDESALTGESIPVHKHSNPLEIETVLADRKNLAFAGTFVTVGEGLGIVWATGDKTETGRIALLITQAVELSTPLTRKIAAFSRWLMWLILGLAAGTFAIGVIRGEKPLEMFMAAVALAVGAIPEGLPAAVTVVLAISVGRMARRRAIIRKLPAVETLGSTTVICSDKTGTLTENQMTVRRIFAGGDWYDLSGSGYDRRGEIQRDGHGIRPEEHPALIECLLAGVLCNDTHIAHDHPGRPTIHGDPTEAALLISAEKAGLFHGTLSAQHPRLDMIPFESEHMYRATMHKNRDARIIYKVGAAERLLNRCSDMLERHGHAIPLDKNMIRHAVETMAADGLRVLALARRHAGADHEKLEHRHVAEGLTFLGLQGMMDPPRAEAVQAVQRCHEAGMAVKMITGDHLLTACAVAEQIGIRPTKAMTGADIAKIPEAELPEIVEQVNVFARVAPEQKLGLVRALQMRGHVVAMTGDGVNDAPALKQADIGIAMGIGGTEVAKRAAAMVLTDDNFATIEAAVEEGRNVFDNLVKFIVWTLPTNCGEALILVGAIVMGGTLPALPVQLLWINMTTEILLGLTLVFEPKEPGIMKRPPRNPAEPLLTYALIMRTGLVSILMFVGAYWLFLWELHESGGSVARARTVVINAFVLVEIAYLFNCRSLVRPLVVSTGLLGNRWLWLGCLATLLTQVFFTYAPIMNKVFHSEPLGVAAWVRIAIVAAATLIIVEFEKLLRYRANARRANS